MSKILIIEDDPAIAEVERDYLEIEGMEAEIAEDGLLGVERGCSGEFDLILLDLMLPGMDGFAVCKHLRNEIDIPILIVTARQEDVDQIRGLGLGADDYIMKPFSPSVLMARIKTHLLRYRRLCETEASSKQEILDAGDVVINMRSHRVYIRQHETEFTNKEYELLLYLVQNRDVVFSREDLYEKIWGFESYGDTATVAVHINRLREKIEKNPAKPEYIETVRGAGYRYH